MVLCNDFRGNLLLLFWTMCQAVKGPCDIKYFKISTAYDVWFSRYRPSNMKLATDSALVLLFINFLWAVYVLGLSATSFPGLNCILNLYITHWIISFRFGAGYQLYETSLFRPHLHVGVTYMNDGIATSLVCDKWHDAVNEFRLSMYLIKNAHDEFVLFCSVLFELPSQ